MRKKDIITLVGRERYEAECILAHIDSARPDYGRGGAGADIDLPHDIEEHIWHAAETSLRKVELLFEIYDDMPAFGHLMYAHMHYREWSADAIALWWNETRKRLAGDTISLRQPLQYSMWCDFFEDDKTVDEAWWALTYKVSDTVLLEAVLRVSSPVPYEFKAELYERLFPNIAMHRAIASSLLFSLVDVYGSIDHSAARKLLGQLHLDPQSTDLHELRERLQ